LDIRKIAETIKEEAKELWNESTDVVRIVRGDSDAAMLRLRKSQSVVHSGLRSGMYFGVHLRISARRMALWVRRGSLVGGRFTALVAGGTA
jgi:hypothetical protein